MSSPKDCVFPETIPEEVSSAEEERVVILRAPQGYNAQDPSIYNLADASLLHQKAKHDQKTNFDFEDLLKSTADKLVSGHFFSMNLAKLMHKSFFFQIEKECSKNQDKFFN